MKHLIKLTLLLILAVTISCSGDTKENTKAVKKDPKVSTNTKQDEKRAKVDPTIIAHETLAEDVKEGPNEGVFAVINTDRGNIRLKLEYRKAPATVANFVSLAEGTMKNKYKDLGVPFYDGLNFHRVITKANGDVSDFMIQGGCPLGTGSGNPGYSFNDEFHPDLLHDRPGILSMANSGPRTNGSQFFITVAPTKHLNRRHSVFGHVTEGMDVVSKMIKRGDKINSIKIERIGEAAKDYDAVKVFAETATVVVR